MTKVPEDLAFFSSVQSARRPLPKRPVIRQMAYAPSPGMDSLKNAIFISEYAGQATLTEVEEARADYAKRYKSSTEYGPVEVIRIDGRPAWAYTETSGYGGKVDKIGLTAIVVYPDVTYSIEFGASTPEFQTREKRLEIVQSFRVIKPGSSQGKAFLISGILLGIATFVAWRLHLKGLLPL